MGLALSLARRNLRQRPGRTLFSILGIAVGIATVVMVFALDHNTMVGRTRMANRENWQPDVEVRAGKGVADAGGELRRTPGVARVTAYFQQEVLIGAGERAGGERIPVRLFAVEAEVAPELGVYWVEEGAHLQPGAKQRECLVGARLAAELGVGPGDTVWLAEPRRTAKRVCVEGELQEVGVDVPEPVVWPHVVAGVLSDEMLGRRSSGRVVVVDYAAGRSMYDDAHITDSYWVKKDPAVDLERLEMSLGERFSFDLSEAAVVGQTADERAFRNGIRLAGLFALILGLYVIFHTLSMSLVERVREVGLLDALGTTRGRIAGIFFLEACFIAAAGGVLGLAAGLAATRGLLLAGVTTIGFDKRIFSFDVPWEVVLPLTGVGVGIALLGSVYPLLRARGTSTVAVLRGESPTSATGVTRGFQVFTALLLVVILPGLYFVIAPVVGEVDGTFVAVLLGGVGVLALLIGVPLLLPSLIAGVCARLVRPLERWWPLAGQLAARTVSQGQTRISASVAAIALVTAAFVGLKGMTNSLEAEIDVWGHEALLGKVWVRGLPNVTYDELWGALGPETGVVGIEAGDARVYNPFLVLGLREEELARYGPCQRDPALLAAVTEGQGAILSRRVAQLYDHQVGDALYLSTPSQGVQTFPVAAISDEYGYFYQPDERLYAVVGADYLRRYFCLETDTTSFAALVLEDGASPDAAIAAVKHVWGASSDLNVRAGADLLDWHLGDIRRDFRLFDLILGLTALLAGLGVLNGQLLSALERWKELGVLRALGTSRRQVAGMVVLESLVIGGVGAALGLGIGSLLTPIIVQALQVLSSLALPLRGAGPWLAYSGAGAVAVSLVAGLYPIWRMNRVDAVRAVRTG